MKNSVSFLKKKREDTIGKKWWRKRNEIINKCVQREKDKKKREVNYKMKIMKIVLVSVSHPEIGIDICAIIVIHHHFCAKEKQLPIHNCFGLKEEEAENRNKYCGSSPNRIIVWKRKENAMRRNAGHARSWLPKTMYHIRVSVCFVKLPSTSLPNGASFHWALPPYNALSPSIIATILFFSPFKPTWYLYSIQYLCMCHSNEACVRIIQIKTYLKFLC